MAPNSCFSSSVSRSPSVDGPPVPALMSGVFDLEVLIGSLPESTKDFTASSTPSTFPFSTLNSERSINLCASSGNCAPSLLASVEKADLF